MNDKERILTLIAQTAIKNIPKDNIQIFKGVLGVGDLIMTNNQIKHTKNTQNIMFGFCEEILEDKVLVRGVGDRKTQYFKKEDLTILNKNMSGHSICDGASYDIYRKILNAIERVREEKNNLVQDIIYTNNTNAFITIYDISINKKIDIMFEYNSFTKIDDIKEIIIKKVNESEKCKK